MFWMRVVKEEVRDRDIYIRIGVFRVFGFLYFNIYSYFR